MLEQLAPDELNSSVWADNQIFYSQSKAATLKFSILLSTNDGIKF